MLSPQQSKTNLMLKPSNIPRFPRSLNTSPRNQPSTETSNNESGISTQSSVNRSTYNFLMKGLNDVNSNLDVVAKRCKFLDHEVFDLVQNCKKNLAGVKEKVKELNTEEEEINKTTGELQESSIVLKPDSNEYCSFLEFLVSYEQGKSEMIIKKAKFPRAKLKEIDKALNEEFLLKGVLPNLSKQSDLSQADKMIKESKLLLKKIKHNLSTKAQISADLEQLLEVSAMQEEFISISSLEGQSFIDSKSFLEDSRALIEEKKRFQDLYEGLSNDHKKLTGKYSYLITRFNKQDQELKFQSRTLALVARSLAELRHNFLQFSKEISDYISALAQKFCINSAPCENSLVLVKNSNSWSSAHDRLLKENSKLSATVKDLKKKLLKTQEELEDCKRPADDSDSLDLESNLNDMIEMQKLKDQIRILNFKLYESSNAYSKDLDGYKAVVGKLRNQNFAQEERIRALNLRISEIMQDKDKLLDEISRFHCLPEGKNLHELQVPEVSAEKSSKVQPSDVLEILTDELEDIVNVLKAHNLFVKFHDNNVNLLRRAVEFLAGLKDDMLDESKYFEEVLESLVKERRSRGLSENLLNVDSVLKDKQVEIYRTKLKDKKGQLELLKQQNDYLKRTVKDLQIELAKASPVDAECARGLFVSIVKQVPALQVEAEQMLLVFMKNIGLSQAEIASVNGERRVKQQGWIKF